MVHIQVLVQVLQLITEHVLDVAIKKQPLVQYLPLVEEHITIHHNTHPHA